MEKERCFILILCIEQNEASTIDFDKKKISYLNCDRRFKTEPRSWLKPQNSSLILFKACSPEMNTHFCF